MATTSVYYPQVNFEFDNNPDPIIRRKNNIASARKVLMPARQWGIPGYPKYNDHGVCCVTGVQLLSLGSEAYNKPLLDPDTLSYYAKTFPSFGFFHFGVDMPKTM